MPTPLIISYAKRARKSVEVVEKVWDSAKEQAKGIRRSNIIDKDYWRLVNGLVKKELGLAESLTFKDFVIESSQKAWFIVNSLGFNMTSHTSQKSFSSKEEAEAYKKKFSHAPGFSSARIQYGTSDHLGVVTPCLEDEK
jgi:hypothetical protein